MDSGELDTGYTPDVGKTEMSSLEPEEEPRRDQKHLEALENTGDIMYKIDDTPPWYMCCILGFQHYLTMVGSSIALPLVLTPALCIAENVVKAEIISTVVFVSGMVTILQVAFGVRLPIVQGSSGAFLLPAFAILSLPQYRCPDDTGSAWVDTSSSNSTAFPLPDSNYTRDDAWMFRMNEIQGAVIAASVLEMLIGCCGIVGLLLRYIGPLSIAPTITLIGIALFEPAAEFCAGNWAVAIMTMVFITAFSQYLRDVSVPCVTYQQRTCQRVGVPVFKLFPVILAIAASWLICYILTVTNAIPDDPDHWAVAARTDRRTDVLTEAKWIRVPYPGQWGAPTFSIGSACGMFAGAMASIIESVGDYYACARLAGAPPPPTHAVNRGIFVEGFGCLLAGLWGTGSGTTSYGENIGAIGITKVASRKVIIWGGVIMMFVGTSTKFSALFVTIPDPVVGGLFMVLFGMVAAVGISNLQFVDLNSSRNLFIFGFSLFFGLSMPQWMAKNQGVINTGSAVFDQVATVLLTSSMFVGGALGFFLDNTIPGTLEERGILSWQNAGTTESDNSKPSHFVNKQIDHRDSTRQSENSTSSSDLAASTSQPVDSTSQPATAKRTTHPIPPDVNDQTGRLYSIPILERCCFKFSWTRFIPISPTYKPWKKGEKTESETEERKSDEHSVEDGVVIYDSGNGGVQRRKQIVSNV